MVYKYIFKPFTFSFDANKTNIVKFLVKRTTEEAVDGLCAGWMMEWWNWITLTTDNDAF